MTLALVIILTTLDSRYANDQMLSLVLLMYCYS